MRKKSLVIGIVAIVVILVILLIPMMPIEQAYSETESYERKAVHEVVSATLNQEFELLGRGVYHASIIVVKNIDTKGGTFTVTHRIYDVNGLFGTQTTSNYLGAGETKTFRAEFDTNLGQDVRGEYTVTDPTIIDQRVVTKHRTVYKSIIELLIYR
jgi:hypothetical protein